MHGYFDLTLRAYRVLLQESIVPGIQDGGRSTQKWYCLISRLLRVHRLFYFASLSLLASKSQIHKLVIIIADISTKINDVECHEKVLDRLRSTRRSLLRSNVNPRAWHRESRY